MPSPATTTAPASVGSKLLDEIERVSAKRERWRGYAKDAGPQGCFGPTLALMSIAIDNAKRALAEGNPIKCIAALEALEGYDDAD